MRGRSNLVEINRQYLLCEPCDKWVASVEVLAFPPPTYAWEDVESHPDVFQRHLMGNAVAIRHVSIEYDHGGNMERDR